MDLIELNLEQIANEISSLIERITGKKVVKNHSLMKSGIITSITFVEVLVALEDTFHISIDFTEIDKDTVDSIEGFSAFISKKLKP